MEQPLRILVVDDDETLRETLALLLSSRYEVVTAGSGIEAFEVVKSTPIDLVFSDVCMANGSGEELLEWVRKYHPSIPVVVLVTGYTTLTTEEALRKGAHTVLTKPFARKEILTLVENLISAKAFTNRTPAV